MSVSNTEFLLDLKNKRNSLFPIVHNDLWEFYNLHKASFWIPEEVDLSVDVIQWNNNPKITSDVKHFIKNVLAFFSGFDFLVNEREQMDHDVTVMEYNFFNADKIARENIHSHMYALLIEALIHDDEEKIFLTNSIQEMKPVKSMADWLNHHIETSNFAIRNIACAIVEGIFFSGAFCAIFWIKKQGLLPGLCNSNEFISREEGLHRDFCCYIHKHYISQPPSNEIVIKMIQEAVELQIQFITEALPVSLIGMNKKMMSQYIKYVADHLSVNLIDQKIYNESNPFEWMNMISLNTKSDFFVHRVNNYAKQSALTGKEENQIRFDSEF